MLVRFYNSYIRSRLSYGLEVFTSASPSTLARLEVIQNHALRIITGLNKSTPISILQVEANLPSLLHYLDLRRITFLKRCQGLYFHHRTFQARSTQINDLTTMSWITYPHKTPFILRTKTLCSNLGLEFGNFKYFESFFVLPPWFPLGENINLDFWQGCQSNPSISLAFLTQTNYVNCLSFYTDGSKSPQGVGSAVFLEDFEHTLSWRLHKDHTVLASELFAVLSSLKWIFNNLQECRCVIYTDSKVALLLVRNKIINSYFGLIISIHMILMGLKDKNITIFFQWVPSHCGIFGNEVADSMAKHAISYSETTHLDFEVKEEISHCKQFMKNFWKNIASLNILQYQYNKIIGSVDEWKWISTGYRYADVILAKLRSGCIALNSYLFRIGKVDSPNCSFCPMIYEDVSHFLLFCTKYDGERRSMRDNLLELGLTEVQVTLVVLLSGGGFKPHIRRAIFRAVFQYVVDSGRLEVVH